MARSRLIHPGAPTDEAVAKCSVYARLVWAYLPCHVDREGRCDDKPFELKLRILPTDDVDMGALLGELARANLIIRYQVRGRGYVQIRTFNRHQNPHRNEASSVIPPPPAGSDAAGRTNDPSPRVTPAPPCDTGILRPERSGDPVTDPVPEGALQIPSEHISPSEADPDPERAIPGTWPEQEPEAPTVHHAVVRYQAPAPAPARDAPGLRAQRLVDMFGRIRSEVGQTHGRGSVPWHHGSKDFARAVEFVERLDREGHEPVSVGEVERTMRAHLEWAVRQPERKHFEVGWAFACWDRRFDDWLERVRGLSPPEMPGLTDRERKSLANGQQWITWSEEQEANR
jgi:hypothetical protein